MEAERWKRIEALCQAALEQPPEQRAAFLAEACPDDPQLRGEAQALLDQQADSFLESSPRSEMHAPIPATIGRYRVLRLLGEGGMGAVYEAEQDQPRRTVALKVIKPGLATAEMLRRFQHEWHALGRLQHPGIAQIYEASTADTGYGPQPFFAMELIRGCPLHEYAAEHQLKDRERLALMARICDAVDHAHQRGVIHRDLKPGNILVDETGQPKILDFGVARVTDSDVQQTRQTDVGQLVGTLAYMSPEQVQGDPSALDIRSDVYALGVILYELLAGRLPYQISRKPLAEAALVIREEDPAPLSSVDRSYRGDIDTIVAKALEKDKARRYGSAAELAGDIRRYLADQPITARPASARYQLQKFGRRHKALVAGAAAVFLVLVAGVVASTWEAVRARKAEAVAQAVNDFLQNDLLAQASANKQSGPGTKPDPDLKVRTALDRAAARIGGKFDRQPEVEAAIRETVGETYFELGLYPEARKQLERALELYRRAAGVESLKTLNTTSRLGRIAYLQGEYPQSEALFRQALKIQRRVLGPEHPDTLYSMSRLANLRELQGKYAEAQAIRTQVLEAQRRVFGPEHPETLKTTGNLALAYANQGKYAQAQALYIEVLEKQRRVLGPEHPSVLYSMSNLAFVYSQQGNYAQTEKLFSQVVEIERRVMGPEHPLTLHCMGNLAEAYNVQGKLAQAEGLSSQLLEINRRVLGPEHPDTLRAMQVLAEVYYNQGRYAQAESLCGKTLQIRRRVLGPEHPDTLDSMGGLAKVYAVVGKYAESDALFSQTLELMRRVLGPENPETLATLFHIGFRYQRQGKYAQAESYAADYLRGVRHAFGPEHPYTIDGADALALAHLSQEKFAESEPLAREAVNFYRKNQPDDWQRFRAESLLGASLAGQKKYAEAEPLLVEGYKGMVARKDRIAVPELYHLDRAREWILELYIAWGKPARVRSVSSAQGP